MDRVVVIENDSASPRSIFVRHYISGRLIAESSKELIKHF